jgi:hypothetical protein
MRIPISTITRAKMDWRCGSSSIPVPPKKKKKKKKKKKPELEGH